jgi:hypothetical protein
MRSASQGRNSQSGARTHRPRSLRAALADGDVFTFCTDLGLSPHALPFDDPAYLLELMLDAESFGK